MEHWSFQYIQGGLEYVQQADDINCTKLHSLLSHDFRPTCSDLSTADKIVKNCYEHFLTPFLTLFPKRFTAKITWILKEAQMISFVAIMLVLHKYSISARARAATTF